MVMNHQLLTAPPGRILLTALVLTLTGCAEIPALGQLASLKDGRGFTTTQSFAVEATQWPDERWWRSFNDPQLDALIDEALQDSPDLAAAAARFRNAAAIGQVAGAALYPQLNANASATEAKQSYNYLTPKSMTPEGWNDYGRSTLDFS